MHNKELATGHTNNAVGPHMLYGEERNSKIFGTWQKITQSSPKRAKKFIKDHGHGAGSTTEDSAASYQCNQSRQARCDILTTNDSTKVQNMKGSEGWESIKDGQQDSMVYGLSKCLVQARELFWARHEGLYRSALLKHANLVCVGR